MYDTVGTPLSFSYNGNDYRVKADVSIAEKFRTYDTEHIQTSGDDMPKKSKATSTLPGLVLTTNQKERQQLDEDADSGPHKAVYVDAAGSQSAARHRSEAIAAEQVMKDHILAMCSSFQSQQ